MPGHVGAHVLLVYCGLEISSGSSASVVVVVIDVQLGTSSSTRDELQVLICGWGCSAVTALFRTEQQWLMFALLPLFGIITN